MTRYKPTLFKKAVSLLAAAAMLVTFLPKLDFGIEAHAQVLKSESCVANQYWSVNLMDFMGYTTPEAKQQLINDLGAVTISEPVDSDKGLTAQAFLDSPPADYVSTYGIIESTALYFTAGSAGTYKFNVNLYKDFGDTDLEVYTVTMTVADN